jgi:arylsulfatase A-like enzyme
VIFSWPGRLPGGRKRDDLVSVVDLFSTLLDFAGVEPPPDRTGISLGPALLADGEFPRETVIGGMSSLRPPRDVEAAKANPSEDLVRAERAYFLRNESWHYVWYSQRERYGDRVPEELYRIDQDPREERNVVGEHPELAKGFRDEIKRWLDNVVARTKSAT